MLGTAGEAHRENDAGCGGGDSVARGRDVRAFPFPGPTTELHIWKIRGVDCFLRHRLLQVILGKVENTQVAGFDGLAANQVCISIAARPHPQHARSRAPAPLRRGKVTRHSAPTELTRAYSFLADRVTARQRGANSLQRIFCRRHPSRVLQEQTPNLRQMPRAMTGGCRDSSKDKSFSRDGGDSGRLLLHNTRGMNSSRHCTHRA
jgi:hypothetical protein